MSIFQFLISKVAAVKSQKVLRLHATNVLLLILNRFLIAAIFLHGKPLVISAYQDTNQDMTVVYTPSQFD
jgi:hypothetical protein